MDYTKIDSDTYQRSKVVETVKITELEDRIIELEEAKLDLESQVVKTGKYPEDVNNAIDYFNSTLGLDGVDNEITQTQDLIDELKEI